jgi:hypothetical protein
VNGDVGVKCLGGKMPYPNPERDQKTDIVGNQAKVLIPCSSPDIEKLHTRLSNVTSVFSYIFFKELKCCDKSNVLYCGLSF